MSQSIEQRYKGYVITSNPEGDENGHSPNGNIEEFNRDGKGSIGVWRMSSLDDYITEDEWVSNTEDEAHKVFIKAAMKFIDNLP